MRKTFVVFFIATSVVLGLLDITRRYLVKQQDTHFITESRIIQDTIKDRFELFLRIPLNVGTMGAAHFRSGDLRTKDYSLLMNETQMNPEILGLNILDEKGVIIRGFPEGKNAQALGKTTQNLAFLLAAEKQGLAYWLSPPFQLYQGTLGFAFYVPIKKEGRLKGWFASVVSTELLMNNIRLKKLLGSYHLSILDELTGMPYLSTGSGPENGPLVVEGQHLVQGRKLRFRTWLKDPVRFFIFTPTTGLLVALSLGALGAMVYQLIERRRGQDRQLHDIGVLLRLTSKEALNNLVNLQSHRNDDTDAVTYLTHLIEQMDLLQTMAHTKEVFDGDSSSFHQLLEQQLENFTEVGQRKRISVTVDPRLAGLKVSANRSLIQNTVLNNILAPLFIQLPEDSKLEVFLRGNSIIFSSPAGEISTSGKNYWDGRLEVARKALKIYGGDLLVQREDHRSLNIRMILPGT